MQRTLYCRRRRTSITVERAEGSYQASRTVPGIELSSRGRRRRRLRTSGWSHLLLRNPTRKSRGGGERGGEVFENVNKLSDVSRSWILLCIAYQSHWFSFLIQTTLKPSSFLQISTTKCSFGFSSFGRPAGPP